MPAAIPLIATAVSTGYDAYKSHKAGQQQKALLGQTTGLAQQQANQGRQLFNFGMPLLGQSADYYSRILTGDRGAMRSALAPETGAIRDTYTGAQRNLERSGIVGAQKDVASADLARQEAGQLGGLFPAARRSAAEALTGLGGTGVSGGVGATAGAGSLFNSLLSGQRLQGQADYEHSMAAGENWGNILVDFYRAYQAKQAQQRRLGMYGTAVAGIG